MSKQSSRTTRRAWCAGAVTVALLALAACGGSGDSSSSGSKTLTIVTARSPEEPIGLLVRLAGAKAYTDLAGDTLMIPDGPGKLAPQLATSWKQIDDHNWEFTLRQGVKFHDGEEFDAAAAAWSINKETAEDSPARVVRYAKNLEATAKDKFTLAVKCPDACPILDVIAPQLQFEAPQWSQKNPDKAKTWPMGTGPFYLAERTDTFLLYKKFKDYWGKTGPFDQVKIVWRSDPSVRAAMVKTGEAQLTSELEPQQIKSVPKTFQPDPVDYAWIRLRGRDAQGKLDPIWGDQRFRQALAYALDCDAMAKTIMQGTVPCVALPYNPKTVGYVADAPRYTYDPKKARQLLDDVLGPGKTLSGVHVFSETGDIPRTLADAILSYWKDVGINATFQFVDGARYTKLHQPGPKGVPPDVMVLSSATNDLYDASLTYAQLDGCNEQRSYNICDPVLLKKLTTAAEASGDERRKLMEELTLTEFIPLALEVPLWPSPNIFGVAKNLNWPNPSVFSLRPDQMSLS